VLWPCQPRESDRRSDPSLHSRQLDLKVSLERTHGGPDEPQGSGKAMEGRSLPLSVERTAYPSARKSPYSITRLPFCGPCIYNGRSFRTGYPLFYNAHRPFWGHVFVNVVSHTCNILVPRLKKGLLDGPVHHIGRISDSWSLHVCSVKHLETLPTQFPVNAGHNILLTLLFDHVSIFCPMVR
jgi:hypothetical protein